MTTPTLAAEDRDDDTITWTTPPEVTRPFVPVPLQPTIGAAVTVTLSWCFGLHTKIAQIIPSHRYGMDRPLADWRTAAGLAADLTATA